MKSLKFKASLVPKILSGDKTITWRLLDDKNLTVGDELEFVNAETKEAFGKAKIIKIEEQALNLMTEEDRLAGGWKASVTIDTLVAHYQKLYGPEVTGETLVKIVSFAFEAVPESKSESATPHYREFEKKSPAHESKPLPPPPRTNRMAYRAVSRPTTGK